MTTFEDILKLCEGEQGKIFVMNTHGDVQFVVMGGGEYQKLKSTQKFGVVADPEIVNREIVNAQLADAVKPVTGSTPVPHVSKDASRANPYAYSTPPEIKVDIPKRDMREEVIDPSFDFDSPEEV